MCIRDRLFSEYDQRTKFYNKKKELVHAEIMLPSYCLLYTSVRLSIISHLAVTMAN